MGHEIFDFNTYNSIWKSGCGKNGCAIGECPIVWPNKWEFDLNGNPSLIGSQNNHTDMDAMIFFELNTYEYEHLFLPNSQDITKYGGKSLHRRVSKFDVADNIDIFINFF